MPPLSYSGTCIFRESKKNREEKAPPQLCEVKNGENADSALAAAVSAAVAKRRLDDLQTANLHTAAVHPFRAAAAEAAGAESAVALTAWRGARRPASGKIAIL